MSLYLDLKQETWREKKSLFFFILLLCFTIFFFSSTKLVPHQILKKKERIPCFSLPRFVQLYFDYICLGLKNVMARLCKTVLYLQKILLSFKASEELLRKMPPTIVWEQEFDMFITPASRCLHCEDKGKDKDKDTDNCM